MMKISLAAARVNARLTQQEAADRIGVTRTTISNWERGQHTPTSDRLLKISEVYGVPAEQLAI